jgi:hypothetical protein
MKINLFEGIVNLHKVLFEYRRSFVVSSKYPGGTKQKFTHRVKEEQTFNIT